tara:strand:- start:20764 stop:22668 length:1905 start_codon:yes stop_codon:yes gene_type:complete
MATTKKLQITEFDFDQVKSNLKTFMKNQDHFVDYDFEGSGMSALLDVLAYNTHYLGYNMNAMANEMFLDSASLRSSVVSHAKHLGYETTSVTASTANVNIKLNTSSLNTATMPAGTKFISNQLDGIAYEFVTIDDMVGYSAGNHIPFENVTIYEGTRVSSKYTVDSTNLDQKFLLADKGADTKTLRVSVQNSASDTTLTTFTKTTDITQVTGTSDSFFLEEHTDGRYEVYFGDGVVGKKLDDGNIVILTYVVTNSYEANGATSFTNSGAIDGVTDITTTIIDNSSGGSDAEGISSIKLRAPLDFASQGRCVTTEDYKLYAKKLYPNTKAVSVWGGESGSFDPAIGVVSTAAYGKVFISIKSTTGVNLTDTEKNALISQLDRYKVASITPVIVDPETTEIVLETKFKFNSNLTTKLKSELESDILSRLQNHNTNTLQQFASVFRYSAVSKLIDDSNPAVLNNITTVRMSKSFTPTLSTAQAHTLNFNNGLYHPYNKYNAELGGVLTSTGFKVDGSANIEYFDDDGEGNVRRYYYVGNTRTYTDKTAGTINYTSGSVIINRVNITTVERVDGEISSRVRITVLPDSKDIVPVRNQILEIDFVNTSVVGEVDTVAVGDSSSASDYITNSSFPSNKSI